MNIEGQEDDITMLLYSSSLVLLIAHWQNFVEETLRSSTAKLSRHTKDPCNLSAGVKASIGQWALNKGMFKDPQKSMTSMWHFSHDGWRAVYREFCTDLIDRLNTPSPRNVKDITRKTIGNNLDQAWSCDDQPAMSSQILDVIEVRHKIVHGTFSESLSKDFVLRSIKAFTDVAARLDKEMAKTVTSHLANCGKSYNLRKFKLDGLINFLKKKPYPISYSIDELRFDPTWFGNHNKLSHDDWPFFTGRPKNRIATEFFYDFIDGWFPIPDTIISFGGKESIPHPDATNIYIMDITK